MKKKYDLVIYIGRFQPIHRGHVETIRRASALAKEVLVLVGSATGPRTIKNPWTYIEREEMIRDACRFVHDLHIDGVDDYQYNDNKWITTVGEKVNKIAKSRGLENIAVIGHDKDHSSYYLNFFPQWKYERMPAYPSENDRIDSTKIRELMFSNNYLFTFSVMPVPVFGKNDPISNLKTLGVFDDLQKEWDFVQDYKKQWSASPYEPTFVTVDAVVEQSGHVLLIERGGFPGKGQWAMPGGFIDINEKLVDCVVRELREETGLKVPEKVLRGSIIARDVFDDPLRSTRGRTITHAFYFKLDDSAELPRVKGGDDAVKAKWISLADFEEMQSVMYEDHFAIMKNMLNRQPQQR